MNVRLLRVELNDLALDGGWPELLLRFELVGIFCNFEAVATPQLSDAFLTVVRQRGLLNLAEAVASGKLQPRVSCYGFNRFEGNVGNS